MTLIREANRCDQLELVPAYAMCALPSHEAAAMQKHVPVCAHCYEELKALRLVIDWFVCWPTGVLRPAASLWERLASRIAAEPANEAISHGVPRWLEPEWEEVAPGISCKLLATDQLKGRVSMLVRLGAGVAYPPHTHAGPEELHLLDGALWMNDRKLYPGDYSRMAAGTADEHVWSETGCTCFLTASIRDVLRQVAGPE